MDTKRYSDWSKLCPDLLLKILENLSPIDHHLAKYVCSDWYSVWKTCVNRPPCPLRIIHQGDDSSKLSDPNKDKLYARRTLVRQDLNSGYCMASSGKWLLMIGFPLDFYLLNIMTGKRINLPSMSTLRGQVTYVRRYNDCLDNRGHFLERSRSRSETISLDVHAWKTSASLWINETTEEYAVAWIFRQQYFFSCQGGYTKEDCVREIGFDSWLCLETQGFDTVFLDVACNKRSYLITTDQRIGNFSFRFDAKPGEYISKRKIAVNKSGESLIMISLKEARYEERLLFYVFKRTRGSCKWERVYSIGDNEMVIFGHGDTVNAPVKDFGDGMKSNIICFVEDDVWPDHQGHENRASGCGIFDLATSRIEWRKKVRYYINKTQWFVPEVAY